MFICITQSPDAVVSDESSTPKTRMLVLRANFRTSTCDICILTRLILSHMMVVGHMNRSKLL